MGRAQLNKRGRPGLRLVLFLAAANAVRHCRELRAFYHDLVGRSRKPLGKMQATVAVACKLIRALWRTPALGMGMRECGPAEGPGGARYEGHGQVFAAPSAGQGWGPTPGAGYAPTPTESTWSPERSMRTSTSPRAVSMRSR